MSKRPSESDTRANIIMLTEKGAEKVAKALEIAEDVDSNFFRSLRGNYREFLLELGALTKANGPEEVKIKVSAPKSKLSSRLWFRTGFAHVFTTNEKKEHRPRCPRSP